MENYRSNAITSKNIHTNSMISNIFSPSNLKWIIVFLPLAYMFFLLYFSIVNVLKLSVYTDTGFTFSFIKEVLTDPVYLKVLWITVKTAGIVTIFTLIIAYPITYLAAVDTPKWKTIIIGTVMITFWISLLVRTFTWLVILRDHGIINSILLNLGIIDEPIKLVYNFTGVVIGMAHILLPYMVLSLYSVMENIDKDLIDAAKGLGAKRHKVFMQIFFPLSLPGVISGTLIVFVLGLGYFVTPMLIGGKDNIMISQLIQQNIQVTLNWNRAAALSLLLLVATFICLGIAYLFMRNVPLLKGGSRK